MKKNVIKTKSGITINVDANVILVIWNTATCSRQNCKYLASCIDDSVIMCDEIIKK